jgi:hypothetical protein
LYLPETNVNSAALATSVEFFEAVIFTTVCPFPPLLGAIIHHSWSDETVQLPFASTIIFFVSPSELIVVDAGDISHFTSTSGLGVIGGISFPPQAANIIASVINIDPIILILLSGYYKKQRL